jgi:hypothetical protein
MLEKTWNSLYIEAIEFDKVTILLKLYKNSIFNSCIFFMILLNILAFSELSYIYFYLSSKSSF